MPSISKAGFRNFESKFLVTLSANACVGFPSINVPSSEAFDSLSNRIKYRGAIRQKVLITLVGSFNKVTRSTKIVN